MIPSLIMLACVTVGAAADLDGGPEERIQVIAAGPGASHYLSWGGKPFFLIGDSGTQGWVESGADFDQEAYVRALAARRIRALLVWSFIAPQPREDPRIGYHAPALLPWVRDGTGRWDLGRLDDAYFARLRSLCESARRAGIAVIVQVFDGWTKTRFATHPFNAGNGGPLADRAHFVELAEFDRELPESLDPGWGWRERNQFFQERFAARLIGATSDLGNVLYELFNEGEWYDPEKRRRHETHFLAFFRTRCRSLLITNDDHIEGPDFRGDPRNDIISHHRPNWSRATSAAASFDLFRRAFAGTPAKPFLFSEPVPEFEGAEREDIDALTRLMWGTALAGAGFVVQNDASFGFNPKARMAARAAARDAMLDREGACARFFNDLGVEWIAMAPADPGMTSAPAALGRRGFEYVLYAEAGGDVTLDLSDCAGAAFERRLYDPRTGELGKPERVTAGITPLRIAKPDSRDWVVWLRRAGAPPIEAPGRG